MAGHLQMLAFRSEASSATEALGGLLDILRGAQKRNETLELTGAIAVSGARSFQVLEGAGEAIDAALARIKTDPRHGDIQIMARRPVAHRLFETWSLASALMLPTLKLQIDLAVAACEEDCDYAITLLRTVVVRQDLPGYRMAA